MFAIRAALASTMSSGWGVYSGFELFEHRPFAEGSEEYLNSEKYELRPRDFEAAPGRRRVAGAVPDPAQRDPAGASALHQLRTIRFHHVDNDALLACGSLDSVTGDSGAGGGDAQSVRPGGGDALAGYGRVGYGAHDRSGCAMRSPVTNSNGAIQLRTH